MKLLDQLEETAANAESFFRRVLAKEDAARIRTLCDLADEATSMEDYLKRGLYIGWTRDDMRTWELKDQLTPLMEAIFALRHSAETESLERKIDAAWVVFNEHRMRVLVHCL